MGRIPGSIVALAALAVVAAFHLTQDVSLSGIGYLARAAVFAGAVATGAQAAPEGGAGTRTPAQQVARLLTARPQVIRSPERLSRRELQVLEMIATGASIARASQETAAGTQAEVTSRMGAASAVEARVLGCSETDRVLLALQDGRTLAAPLVGALRGQLEVGTPAIVYFDQHGGAVGWYAPGVELGVDMRDWNP
jgi:hypothetical protein